MEFAFICTLFHIFIATPVYFLYYKYKDRMVQTVRISIKNYSFHFILISNINSSGLSRFLRDCEKKLWCISLAFGLFILFSIIRVYSFACIYSICQLLLWSFILLCIIALSALFLISISAYFFIGSSLFTLSTFVSNTAI